jgi:hypothetical protein
LMLEISRGPVAQCPMVGCGFRGQLYVMDLHVACARCSMELLVAITNAD